MVPAAPLARPTETRRAEAAQFFGRGNVGPASVVQWVVPFTQTPTVWGKCTTTRDLLGVVTASADASRDVHCTPSIVERLSTTWNVS